VYILGRFSGYLGDRQNIVLDSCEGYLSG
jgi:hypothetical protein